MELNTLKKDYGFEMKKEDKEYHIKVILKGEKIKISIEYILGVIKTYFSNEFNINEIQTLNRYFNICLTLSDIFEELINLISTLNITNENQFEIIQNKFELIKENKEKKSEIENILEIINHQNKRIKYLEEENEKKTQIIKELKLKLSLFAEDDFNLVKSYIKNNINKVKLVLLFDSQRDGFINKTFFKLCQNKFKILTLFKAIEGEKFGGYTYIPFREKGNFYDSDSFLFSINYKRKYKPRQYVDYALNLRSDRGPIFGYSPDIETYYNMKNGWITYDKYSTFLINDSFTQGKTREFEFSNIEIYQVFLN